MFTFIESSVFERICPIYLDDDEYAQLQQHMMLNPEAGEVVQGFGGVRKLRWARRWRRTGMSSQPHGESTSVIEVTDISPHGIWVRARGEEFFLPYETFPWFKTGTVEAVLNVEEQSPGHYDVDLGLDTMRNPDKYPLTFERGA